MITSLGLILSLAAFAALALSMPRYHRDLFGEPTNRSLQSTSRIAGWTLLSLSLAVCISGLGVSIGIVLWVGMLTVAALAVAAALSLMAIRRRSLPPLK